MYEATEELRGERDEISQRLTESVYVGVDGMQGRKVSSQKLFGTHQIGSRDGYTRY